MTEKATGGNVTDVTIGSITYRVHTFTGNGVFEVLEDNLEVDYLVVAGGGSGGGDNAGGGGAGGLIYSTNQSLPSTDTVAVTIGDGGSGVAVNQPGNNGQNSVLSSTSLGTITAIGGGAGGAGNSGDRNGNSGGSGGGGASESGNGTGGAGTSGQGNSGGNGASNSGGGGGGAGQPGASATAGNQPGNGGDGLEIDITGVPTYYAGGGGGGPNNTTAIATGFAQGGVGGGGDGGLGTGQDATPNTGGGGGGAGWNGSVANSGSGGSGVVIIRYVLQAVDSLDVSSDISVFGDTFTATVTVAGAEDNTTVPYTITGVDSSDIDNFPLSGNFTVVNKQSTISFTVTPSTKKSFTITANGFTETVEIMPKKATGGNVTDVTIDGIAYRVHTFTGSSSFEVLEDNLEVDYLVVGGGGGGAGAEPAAAGGGGGGGGVVTGSIAINTNQYPIVVGAGGADANSGDNIQGNPGENSSAFGIVGLGGGEGARWGQPGGAGGSGGGAGGRTAISGGTGLQPTSSSSGFGNDGGKSAPGGSAADDAGGGGGGAGGAGGDAGNQVGGSGGTGLISAITGIDVYYAGGGGGGTEDGTSTATGGLGGGGAGGNANSPSTPGIQNTGGGGGGSGGNGGSVGSAGGSGVVIIRYALQNVDGLSISSSELISGDVFTSILTVVDAADNTTVPYTITGVDSSDIDNFPLSGNFTITNEKDAISFTATPDSKKTMSITANGFTETVDLVENIYGLKQLTVSNSLAFTSEALSVIDLSNVDYALEITILQPDNLATYNLGASPSVLLELRKFITIDFASKTSFNSSEALDFDPPQYWIGA